MASSARRLAAAAAACAALLLGGAAPAVAAGELPNGQTDGVRIVPRGDRMTIVFDRKASAAYRAIAGRRVVISCTRRLSAAHLIGGGSGGYSHPVRAARRRSPLRAPNMAQQTDVCRVWLPLRHGKTRNDLLGSEPVVAVALNERGATYLDEEAKALMLYTTIESAAGRGARFLSAARLSAHMRRMSDGAPLPPLVQLSSPAETPPAGALGYYSDGEQHAAAVVLSERGRRLFFELAPDDALHSNVLGLINGFMSDDPT